MPVVPMSRQTKRQQQAQPIPDPKFMLMAMAMMRNEGKLNPVPEGPQSSQSPIPPPEMQQPR